VVWRAVLVVPGVDQAVDAVVRFAVQAVGCTYASVVLVHERTSVEIVALTDPRLVGRATGILMERASMDGYEAFEALKQNSLDTGRTIREVAQELIDARDFAESSRYA